MLDSQNEKSVDGRGHRLFILSGPAGKPSHALF